MLKMHKALKMILKVIPNTNILDSESRFGSVGAVGGGEGVGRENKETEEEGGRG